MFSVTRWDFGCGFSGSVGLGCVFEQSGGDFGEVGGFYGGNSGGDFGGYGGYVWVERRENYFKEGGYVWVLRREKITLKRVGKWVN